MARNAMLAAPSLIRSGRRLATCSAFLLIPWSAWAAGQTNQALDLTSVPLENLLNMEVQSASRFKQTISEAPSAVSVITSTDIKTFGWRTLADILNSLPGIHTTSDRTYTSVGSRGFHRAGDYNIRFLLMIDGHRVNDPLYDQAMVGQEMMVDVDLIDRVEYVPGPGSAVYGSNAFFGVINVITKRGRDFKGGQASVEGGGAGMHRERATIGNQNENGAEWLLSATNYNRDGKNLTFPEFPGQVARGLDYEKVQSVFAKGSTGLFAIAFAHAERKKGIPTANYGQEFNDPRSRLVDTMSFLNIGYATSLNARTDFSARVFYNRYGYHGQYVYGPAMGDVDHDRAASSWWGGDVKLVSTAFAQHKLVTGVEFQKNDPIRQWNYSVDPYTEALNRRDSNYRIGLYVQDEWTLHTDLLLSMGLRFDHNSKTADQNNYNPRLGLIYKLAPNTTAKLLFGKAFRLPNFYELYYDDGGSQMANPNLRPEHIQSSELVLEHQWSANNRVRASAFYHKVKDLITSGEVSPGVTQFSNVGSATSVGVEAEWQQAWNNGTRLRSSLSWQKATDDATGQTLVSAPKWLGKANLSTPFYNNLWRAGAELRYVASRNSMASKLGSYTLGNLTLTSDRLYKGVEVSASIYNLLNRHHAEPAGVDYPQDAIMQDGRTFRVKLTYSF